LGEKSFPPPTTSPQAGTYELTECLDVIDIQVEEGRVTLGGSVASLPAYRAAERIAHKTLGVRKVENRLIIR